MAASILTPSCARVWLCAPAQLLPTAAQYIQACSLIFGTGQRFVMAAIIPRRLSRRSRSLPRGKSISKSSSSTGYISVHIYCCGLPLLAPLQRNCSGRLYNWVVWENILSMGLVAPLRRDKLRARAWRESICFVLPRGGFWLRFSDELLLTQSLFSDRQ